MKPLLSYLILFFVIAFAQVAKAQEITDTLLLRSLEEVTIVSSRLPSGLLKSARSIYYQDLDRSNQSNQGLALDEALQYVPGVFSLDALNFSQDIRISVRGFGSRAAFGVRGIKMLVDGIPATTPDGQTQLDHVDVQSLDALEVMTGAVGGMYGNASGGAISLRTKLPGQDLVRISSNFGSFGLLRNQVRLAKVTDDWVFELSGSQLKIDGYRQNSTAKTANLKSRITYRREKAEYQFLAHFTDSPTADDAGGISLDDVTADRTQARAQNLTFRAGEAIREGLVAINTKHALKNNQRIEGKAYYINRDFANLLPFMAGGAVAFKRDFTGLNLQYTLENKDYRLLVGVETERQKDARTRKNNNGGTPGELLFDQDELFGMIGLYVLQDFKLNDRFTLDLTTRLDLLRVTANDHFLSDGDQSGTIKWQHVSPSLGINYQWSEGHFTFATAGHSFETPALSELSNSPTGAGGFNSDLNPQSANHFEIGFKGFISDWFYQCALFHIDLKNELLPFELESFPGRTFYRNAGASDRNGVELAVKGNLVKNLLLAGSYTFSDFTFSDYDLDGTNLSGKAVSGIPKHFGGLGLNYNKRDGLFLAVDYLLTGKLFANDNNSTEVPGYNLMHVRGGWNFEFKQTLLKVHAGIRNITDTEYFDNIRINAFGGRFYEPAPGRNYFGGVTIEF